jgi:hypothetical protein
MSKGKKKMEIYGVLERVEAPYRHTSLRCVDKKAGFVRSLQWYHA